MKKFLTILILLLGFGTLTSCDLFHSHSYDQMGYDAESHWEECSCGDKQNIEQHTFDDGVVISEPTETTDGLTEYSCTICGYYYQETTHYQGHIHSASSSWSKDKDYHWHTCSGCSELLDKESHSFTLTSQKEPTVSKDGENVYTCSVCGYSYKETVEFPQESYNQLAKAIKTEIGELNTAAQDSEYAQMLSLEERYQQLNAEAKVLVTNYSSLTTKLNTIKAKVNATIDLINDIGLIYEDNGEVQAALNSYNSLSECLYSYITNKDVLTAAETQLDAYKAVKTAIENKDRETYQQIVKNVAYMFYYQGTQIQYDQNTDRRNFYATAEDANSYNYTYLDCSSFVNAVYHYIFDANIITKYSSKTEANANSTAYYNSFASTYYGTKAEVIFYSASESNKTDARAKEIRNLLEVGDIYTYRHGNAGHVMLYIGKIGNADYFLHCTGLANSSTNPNDSTNYTDRQSAKEKSSGAIVLENADAVFVGGTDSQTGTNRYIFASDNTSWSIMRPLEKFDGTSYSITNAGIARLLYPLLDIEKASSVGNYHSVAKDGVITYTLSLSNKGTSPINYIYVEDVLPEGVELVSASGNYVYDKTTRTIKWHLAKLNGSARTTLTYKVKVTGTTGTSLLDITYVNGIRTNMLQNDINIESSKNETKTLTTYIKSKVNTSYNSMAEMLNEAYYKVYGKSEVVGATNKTCISNIFSGISSDSKLSDNYYTRMIPSIMYGGVAYRSYAQDDPNGYNNSDNMRNVLPSYLEEGDIIATYYSETANLYYYVSSTEIYGIDSNGKLNQVYTGTTSPTVTQFVHSLPFYSYFAVLRPTLAM